MFQNILTKCRALRRCAIAAICLGILSAIFQCEAQAGPLRRMRRRAARATYGTTYSTGYPGYTSGYVGPAYYGPAYALYGPMGGFGPAGAFGPGYFGAYATGPYAPLPPIGPARGRQYYGAQPLAPPPAGNSPGLAGPVGPNDPARSLAAGQANPQATLDNAAFVRQLYRDNLNREPDEAGLNAWVQALDRGMSRRAATNYFLNSRERAAAPSAARPAATAGPTLAPPQNGPALAGPPTGVPPAGNFDGNEELPVPPQVADQNNGPPPRVRSRARRQPDDGFEF